MNEQNYNAIDACFRRADALLRRLGEITESYERIKAETNEAIASAEKDFNRKKVVREVQMQEGIVSDREALDRFREEQRLIEHTAREGREAVLAEMEELRVEMRVLGVELDLNPGVRNRL